MGIVATIETLSLTVDPGAEATCAVRVRNTGQVVDRIHLDVLGDAAGWAEIEPPQLNLLPDTEATALVRFRPPRSPEVRAAMVDFAVRARSQEDPEGSVVQEGTVTVAPFTDLVAELAPRTRRGRRAARFRLVVSNFGNAPVGAEISALDKDGDLRFALRPGSVLAEPGTATLIRLRTAPRARFVKGPDRTLPFQVFVLPEESEPVIADGAMVQRQMMPTWLLPAIALVVAGCAALVALWFLVLKPTVTSSAEQAVAQQTQQLASSASAANQAAGQASKAAAAADSAAAGGSGAGTAGGGAGAAGAAGAKSSATPVPSAANVAVSAQLESSAAPTQSGAFATYTYALPAGRTGLDVSDLVLENPLGDSGILQIRSGRTTLLEFGLDNFRSLDLHYVQPLEFGTGSPLVLAVKCLNTNGNVCTAAISFSGNTHK